MAPPDRPPPGGPEIDDGGSMRAAILSTGVCAVALAAGAFAFAGVRPGFGVAVGGAIATANLWLLARIGRAFVSEKGRGAWVAIAVLKLVVLFGGVFLLIKSGVVSGVSLAIGYGALPIGITLGSLFGPKPPDDVATR
ncbi:MAG TPA: ATP synthase subunit I [Minicystis sp.]|nr:ATP synthase subunit I [Minicystis sp.]